jgi:hypothetical protein
MAKVLTSVATEFDTDISSNAASRVRFATYMRVVKEFSAALFLLDGEAN